MRIVLLYLERQLVDWKPLYFVMESRTSGGKGVKSSLVEKPRMICAHPDFLKISLRLSFPCDLQTW